MDSFKYQRVLYDVRAPTPTVDDLVDLLDIGRPPAPPDPRAESRRADARRPRDGPAVQAESPVPRRADARPRCLAAGALRRFVAEYAASTGATILLTSHYMTDVETLCKRVILIDQSRIRYDGELATLAARFSDNPSLEVVMDRFYRDGIPS